MKLALLQRPAGSRRAPCTALYRCHLTSFLASFLARSTVAPLVARRCNAALSSKAEPVAKQETPQAKVFLATFLEQLCPSACFGLLACPSLCHRSHTDVTQAVFPKHYPCFCLACTCVYVTMYCRLAIYLLTTKYTYVIYSSLLIE